MSGYGSDFQVFVGTFVKFFGTLTLCSLRVFNFILTRKYGHFLQIQISVCKGYFISERSTGSNVSAFYLFVLHFLDQSINSYKKTHYRLYVNIYHLTAYIKPQINEKPMDSDSRKSIHTKHGFLDLHKVVYNRSKDHFAASKQNGIQVSSFSLNYLRKMEGTQCFTN